MNCLNLSGSSNIKLCVIYILGVLLGIAIRTGSPLSLNLAEPVWKQLAGMNLTIADLSEVILYMSVRVHIYPGPGHGISNSSHYSTGFVTLKLIQEQDRGSECVSGSLRKSSFLCRLSDKLGSYS